MKPADIKIGATYAVHADGELAALKVTKVTTVRTGPHPSDFTHTVTGILAGRPGYIDYGSGGLLGDYAQYAELVAQEKVRNDAAEAAKKVKLDKAQELATLLYQMTGFKPSSDRNNSYRAPITVEYGSGIRLNTDAVDALLAALRRSQIRVVA